VNILDRIVRTKEGEVAELAPRVASLRAAAEAAPAPRDFFGALAGGDTVSLIAEVKRRSPGAGPIRTGLDPAALAASYAASGAAALSVLTDSEYFGGSLPDLAAAREASGLPALRKDFTIDPVQVYEARAGGADAILLIVRILDDDRLGDLQALSLELGMGVLVETHTRGEVERALKAGARILGVNNRDLSTFTTDLAVTLEIMEEIPAEVVLVSESGIRTPRDVDRLGAAGVDGILVGETLLRADDPGAMAGSLANRPRAAR
jgi:indole-3-glycerol phosphate synthase